MQYQDLMGLIESLERMSRNKEKPVVYEWYANHELSSGISLGDRLGGAGDPKPWPPNSSPRSPQESIVCNFELITPLSPSITVSLVDVAQSPSL
jgi:hypothetical protein